MLIEPFLCVDGVQVINHARTTAYLLARGYRANLDACSKTTEACDTACPYDDSLQSAGVGYGETLTGGTVDWSTASPGHVGNEAPWHVDAGAAFVDQIAAKEAFGFLTTKAETSLVYPEGEEDDTLAPCPYRIVEFEGYIAGLSPNSVKAFERWFREKVASCNSQCGGVSLGWFETCSIADSDLPPADPCTNTTWREVNDAVLAELEIGAPDEDEVGPPTPCLVKVTLRFKVENSFVNGPWLGETGQRLLKGPFVAPKCWSYRDSLCSCPRTNAECDTTCSPIVLGAAAVYSPGCYCFPAVYRSWSHSYIASGPSWAPQVFGMTIYSGSQRLKNLLIEFYPADFINPATQLPWGYLAGPEVFCNEPCYAIKVAEVPPYSTLWLDGRTETKGIDCPGGSRTTGSLVEGLDDGWPLLVGTDMYVVITADEYNTADDAWINIRRAVQLDRCLAG